MYLFEIIRIATVAPPAELCLPELPTPQPEAGPGPQNIWFLIKVFRKRKLMGKEISQERKCQIRKLINRLLYIIIHILLSFYVESHNAFFSL